MPATVFDKPMMVEDALREASKLKTAVTDVVKDGVRAANQQIRRSRYAAEDALEEAKHAVKQRPVQALAIAFAAGLLTGSIVACLAMARRH